MIAARSPPERLALVVDGEDAGAVVVGGASPGRKAADLIVQGPTVLRRSVSVHNTLLFRLLFIPEEVRPIRVFSEMAR